MRDLESKRAPYYGWFIVAATSFTAMVTGGSKNAFGVFVVPMSQDLEWNRTTISAAFFVATLVSGIGQPFVGRLYDTLGGRRVILTSLVIIGVCLLLLSLTFHILFLVLIYGVVLSIGMSGGSLSTTVLLVARWFRRKRATALGLSTAGASLGGLTLVPFAAYLMDLTTWRMTWFALGLLVLGLALPLSYLLLRNDPSEMGLQPDGDAEPPPEADPTRAAASKSGPLFTQHWRDSFRSSPIWQLSAAFFVCGFTTSIIAVHFVPYAEGEGYSRSVAATAFGVMSGINVVGVILITHMSDRLGRKNLLAAAYVMRGLAYAVLLLSPGAWGLWGFAVIAGFSWISTAPLTATLTADIYGLKNLGTLAGLTFLVHQMGGASSVLLAGVIYDATESYVIPFSICGVLLVVAGGIAFTVREKEYSSNYRTQTPPQAATATW